MIKRNTLRVISALLAALMCAFVLVGCGGKSADSETTAAQPGSDADTVTTGVPTDTAAGTDTLTEDAPVTDTEADTQDTEDTAKTGETTDPGISAPATEETVTAEPETTVPETTAPETTAPVTTAPETTAPATTAAETEPPQPKEPLTLINAADKENAKLAEYFVRGSYCEAAMTADGVKLTTKDVKTANTNKPFMYFTYKEFAESQGKTNVSLAELPVVVLKVRADTAHDRMAGVTGATAPASITGTEVTATLPTLDGWCYVGFDFSGNKNAAKITTLRISPEAFAGANGEGMTIGEIRFCTKAEAEKLITADTYPKNAGDGDLRLLQFNVQTENGNPAPFIIRSEMYRKLVDELMPDVVGMEEVTVNWRKWLDTYVFNDSYASVGEMRSAGGEANPIYYRKDKYELVDSGTFWLSATPDKSGSYTTVTVDDVEYKANYPRICTWVILKDKTTGRQFAHMNTHLDHNGNNDSTAGNNIRKEQIRVIIRFAERFGDMPVFLTGDLNNRRTTSKNKTYALIKMIEGTSEVTDADGKVYKLALADTRLNAPKTVDAEHTATMTANYDTNSKSYNPSKEPIDYVFYEPNSTVPLSYETFLIAQDGMEISDHLPVFTKFDFKK